MVSDGEPAYPLNNSIIRAIYLKLLLVDENVLSAVFRWQSILKLFTMCVSSNMCIKGTQARWQAVVEVKEGGQDQAVRVYLIRFIADLPLRLVYGLRD